MATRRGSPAVLQAYVFRDGEFMGTEVFVEREIIVGRDPDLADLVLESTQVSREHAMIEIDGTTIIVRDLGSTNGTTLNDAKAEEFEVSRMDEVGLGDFTLKLKLQRGKRERGERGDATVMADVESSSTGRQERAAKEARRRRGSDREREAPRKKRRRPPERTPVGQPDEARSRRREPEPEESLRRRRAAPEEEPRSENKRRSFFGKKEREPERESKRRPPEPPPPGEDSDDEFDAFMAQLEPPEESKPEPRAKRAKSKRRERSDRGAPEPKSPAPAFERTPIVMPDAELAAPEPDDDDLEDIDYVPPYSLRDRLVAEDDIIGDVDTRGSPQVEVLELRGDSVVDAQLIRPGGSFWVGPNLGFLRRLKARDLPPRVRMLRLKRGGVCTVEIRKTARGVLYRGSKKLDVTTDRTLDRKKGTFVSNMKPGDILDVDDGPSRFHVRYTEPPEKTKDDRPITSKIVPDPVTGYSFLSSGGFHLTVLAAVWLFAPTLQITRADAQEFVEVALEQELELEEPKEEPKPPKEKQKPQKKEVPKEKQAAPTKKPKVGGTSKAPAGILGLLNKKGKAAPGPAAVLAKVSNLSSAKVPGGTSGYRVSGLQGKLPTSSLSVGGGGGGILTKGGSALLRGGGGGAGALSGKGTRKVGGLVQKVPKAMRAKGQGTLDRDEIQKVINKNVGQIQRCYERELLKTPGLSGKVQVEWVISTSGSVRSARQTFSNLNSSNAVNCIMSRIKSWRFPRPRGGEVVVNYPFIFKSIGF